MLNIERRADPGAARRVLSALPEWFGIPAAIDDYVADAVRLPSYLAVDSTAGVVGIALLNRYFEGSAELRLIAVDPDYRRTGVGSRLLAAIEADMQENGDRLLLVHTVGPSFDSADYAQTRAFYLASGFIPLQELDGIDWDGPTLLLAKPLYLAGPAA